MTEKLLTELKSFSDVHHVGSIRIDMDDIRALVADRNQLHAENERLREALKFARDCVEEWSSYASDYFRNKWNLEDDLAAIDAALTKEA